MTRIDSRAGSRLPQRRLLGVHSLSLGPTHDRYRRHRGYMIARVQQTPTHGCAPLHSNGGPHIRRGSARTACRRIRYGGRTAASPTHAARLACPVWPGTAHTSPAVSAGDPRMHAMGMWCWPGHPPRSPTSTRVARLTPARRARRAPRWAPTGRMVIRAPHALLVKSRSSGHVSLAKS